MKKNILQCLLGVVIFFCFAQVVMALSHRLGTLSEGVYSDKQTFSSSDLLDEGHETYDEVIATLESSIDEDLLDKILEEVDVYAHYYSFTPEIDGIIRVSEYSNLSSVPDKLKNVSKKDLKDPIKALKIIKEALDVIKSADLYFILVNNDDDITICDIRDEISVESGSEYDVVVVSFKKGCVGKSFSFSLSLEAPTDEPTYKINLYKNADSSRVQLKYICGSPVELPLSKSDLGWSREGYTFKGWSTSARGDVVYTDGAVVSNMVSNAGSTVNLYAVWDLADMKVNFDANGGEVNERDIIVKFGKSIGSLPTPFRSKHKFLGWYTAVDGGTKISTSTKIKSDVTYFAQWIYDGSITILAIPAEGCEAMGKVTGGKMVKAGAKVALKATANKGYVFSCWDGPLDELQDLRSPSISYTAEADDASFVAKFIPLVDDSAAVSFKMLEEYQNGIAIENVAIDVSGCTSLPTVKITGLPTGLKFTAKPIYKKGSKTEIEVPANTIHGTPTKSGVYTVVATVTTAGKKTATCLQTVIVRKSNEKVIVAHSKENEGKVTGSGVYATGKMVTLKATASKGYVFAGWYDDAAFTTPCDSTVVDYRTASYTYTMGASDKTFYARFVPVAEDTVLSLTVDGENLPTTCIVSKDAQLSLDVDSLSLPKIGVKGLPVGMKFTAKPIYKKGSRTEIEVPANTIYGAPTKPSLNKVTVSISNQSIKKAIIKEFWIEVPNLTSANGYFVDKLDNGDGRKRVLSVGITNIDDFLPSLALNSETVKLAVSGLPAGLKYDAKKGKITGVATKAGTYTVTLTVTDGKAKYVSTITIEVEALPDWVVGTFEGYAYVNVADGGDYHDRIIYTISSVGKVSSKGQVEDTTWYMINDNILVKKLDGSYQISSSEVKWDFQERRSIRIFSKVVGDILVGCLDGIIEGAQYEEWCESWIDSYGSIVACQNVWKIAQGTRLAPAFVENTSTIVDMSEMRDDEWDNAYGGYLTLKYGANGAVTTAYSETEGGKATATGSAQLVPYEVNGNITKAWLYTALKTKGRDSFGVLLFLSIDTSKGNVYRDDVIVEDYLLEVE